MTSRRRRRSPLLLRALHLGIGLLRDRAAKLRAESCGFLRGCSAERDTDPDRPTRSTSPRR